MKYDLYSAFLNNRLLPHPLFKVPYDIYRWHSEVFYNTTTEKLLELLDDFERIRAEVEAEFVKNPDLFQGYMFVAHVIWRTYHQLQAKPLLETIIHYDPKQAETYFYLGQIYQDELKDFPQAIKHFAKFIELEPNLVPENNYFIDSWFINTHAYEPSTIEAFINLGDIYLQQYHDYKQAKEYYIKAICLNPDHHLAPYTRLAELLITSEQDFSAALKAYKKAMKNYLQAKWSRYYYSPCNYYPALVAWAEKKYAFTHSYLNTRGMIFANKFAELSILSYQQTGDANFALACIGNAHRVIKMCRTSPSHELYLFQIELVLKHYQDYWQAERLCQKVLAADKSNQKAQEYLALIKAKLRY
ncbi:MAG: hypothetical protein AB1489_09065 [Acidobacteriota bacterium]